MANPRGNANTLRPYKPKWRSGATQTIRVPIALADRLLDIAKRLDNGELTHESQPNLSSEIERVLSDPAITRNGRDRGAIRRALIALQSRLEGTNQDDY
jgi:hypothetical protein